MGEPKSQLRYQTEAVELLEPDQMLIAWRDGHASLLPYRLLRLQCSCASCVDELTGKPLLDPARIRADIKVSNWSATGRYGLNLHFSDGHRTGIYTLRRLRDLCPCPECRSRAVPE
ncbi:MAG: DUF971 domain-containing protein [Planctomycetes bacterium]|nr:DUF971 domain-containing protein [Planctomycetota bacterium]